MTLILPLNPNSYQIKSLVSQLILKEDLDAAIQVLAAFQLSFILDGCLEEAAPIAILSCSKNYTLRLITHIENVEQKVNAFANTIFTLYNISEKEAFEIFYQAKKELNASQSFQLISQVCNQFSTNGCFEMALKIAGTNPIAISDILCEKVLALNITQFQETISILHQIPIVWKADKTRKQLAEIMVDMGEIKKSIELICSIKDEELQLSVLISILKKNFQTRAIFPIKEFSSDEMSIIKAGLSAIAIENGQVDFAMLFATQILHEDLKYKAFRYIGKWTQTGVTVIAQNGIYLAVGKHMIYNRFFVENIKTLVEPSRVELIKKLTGSLYLEIAIELAATLNDPFQISSSHQLICYALAENQDEELAFTLAYEKISTPSIRFETFSKLSEHLANFPELYLRATLETEIWGLFECAKSSLNTNRPENYYQACQKLETIPEAIYALNCLYEDNLEYFLAHSGLQIVV